MSLGERISVARQARGASVKELADALEVASRFVNAWESDGKVPDDQELAALADVLSLHPYYFVRKDPLPDLKPLSYHFLDLDNDLKMIVHRSGQMALDELLNIERLIDPAYLPQGNYPAGFPVDVETLGDVAKAAATLRQSWGVDALAPIPHVTDLLDSNGIRVLSVVGMPMAFDACLFYAEDSAVIVIVINGSLPGDSQRFGIARELGTALLRKCAANQTAFFALTFLAPPKAVRAVVGDQKDSVATEDLYGLKHQFGLSMRILGPYLFQLGILSQDYLKALLAYEDANWEAFEPGEQVQPEVMSRFNQMITILQQQGYEQAHLRALLGILEDDA